MGPPYQPNPANQPHPSYPSAGDLRLRPYQPSDIDSVYDACQDEAIQRWTTVPRPYTREHADEFVAANDHGAWATGTGTGFAVVDTSGRLLGSVGIVGADPEQRTEELGYWVAPWARGRGVATAALSMLARWCLVERGTERVEWMAEVGNVASRRVAERAGFTIEGVRRHHLLGGRRTDVWTGSLLRADLTTDDVPADGAAGTTEPASVGRGGRRGGGLARPFAAEGLWFRAPVETDADMIVAGASDEQTQRWIQAMPSPYTRTDALAWMRGLSEANDIAFVIEDSGEPVGVIGMNPRQNGVTGCGYWLVPTARGRGIAARAVKAVTDRAFAQEVPTARMELQIDPANEASMRVAIAAGYRFEALRRAAAPQRDGGRRDLGCWVRLPDDPAGPTSRGMPDLPADGLSDGVVALRRPILADAAAILAIEADEQSRRWQVLDSPEPTLTSVRERIERRGFELLARDLHNLVIIELSTGQVCGTTGAKLRSPAAFGAVNIGYSTHPDFRGRGYAGRAARLLADWTIAVPDVRRVEMSAAVTNTASLRVLARSGFEYEGVLRAYLPDGTGGNTDVRMYSLIESPTTE